MRTETFAPRTQVHTGLREVWGCDQVPSEEPPSLLKGMSPQPPLRAICASSGAVLMVKQRGLSHFCLCHGVLMTLLLFSHM